MPEKKRIGNRRRRGAALVCVALALAAFRVEATDPGTAAEAAAWAREGAPGLLRAGRALVEVPRQVGQCLRLPLGVVEMAFSPLPGVEFGEGVKDAGRGLVAPFKLGVAVLEMPYEVFGGLGQAVSGVSG